MINRGTLIVRVRRRETVALWQLIDRFRKSLDFHVFLNVLALVVVVKRKLLTKKIDTLIILILWFMSVSKIAGSSDVQRWGGGGWKGVVVTSER